MTKMLAAALIAAIFFGFIVAKLPANFIYQQLELPDNLGPLKVQAISGSIWNGRVDFSGQNEVFSLHWQVLPLSLLTGQLSSHWQFSGSGIDLTGNSRLGNQQSHTVNGSITPGSNNTVSQYLGFYIPNCVIINHWVLLIDANSKPSIAKAKATWPGGEINYLDLRFILPPLQATARQNQLMLTSQTNNKQLVDLQLSPDGWLKVQVFNALMRYSDTPSRSKQPGVSFSFEEKLF